MDITRKNFLKGVIGLAAEITLSPISRMASGVLAAGLATRSATATPIVLVGADSTEEYVYGAGSPNIVVSSLFTAVASGTATSMSIHLNLESGNPIKLSIWTADGLTKLGETTPFADEVGVQTANLVSGVAIVSGTTYLLAAMSSGAYIWVNNDGTGWHDFTADATYPNWPASIPHYTNSGGGKVAIWAGAESSAETFDFYISPTGSDSNDGSLALPWAITALNTKRAIYSPGGVGKRIGLLDGVYDCQSLLGTTSDAPGLDMEGGTPGNPVVLQSVNPRGAILSGNGTYTTTGPLIGHTPGTGRTHRGYIEFRDFQLTNFNCYLLLNVGIFGIHEGLQGIVYSGLWVHDNTAEGVPDPDNVETITLNETDGCLVENNVFEDNINHNNPLDCDHLSACLMWQGRNTIFRYNTVIHSGAGFYAKEINSQGNQVYGNYIDAGMYNGSAYGIADMTGYDTPGLTETTLVHHNVVVSSGSGIALLSTLSEEGGFTTPCRIWNNTIVMTPNAIAENALSVRSHTAGNGLIEVYNNIITGTVSTDAKMVLTNSLCPGKWDYNLIPSGATFRLKADNGSGATVADYSSVSAMRAGIAANGGITNFDLHGVIDSTPGFTGTGSLAQRYQLSSGAAAQGTGRSDGTTSGSAVDMGVWGNNPPIQIGANFTGNYS